MVICEVEMSNSAKDERDFQNAGDTEMSGGEKSTRNKRRGRGAGRLEHWQIIALLLMAYDFVVVNLSYFLALWIRSDYIGAFGGSRDLKS